LDASALVKRYVSEPGTDVVLDAMKEADGWFICRAGYVETMRAVGLAAGARATEPVRQEWPAFGVIEIDQDLVEGAAQLTLEHELRSMDAIHLAAALVLPREDLTLATWDSRLHGAAGAVGVRLLPEALP
jgi:predicted nucleic acid-binding protein